LAISFPPIFRVSFLGKQKKTREKKNVMEKKLLLLLPFGKSQL